METALKSLLNEVIDYAGLFPPTTLPMEPAFRNYASYRDGGDRWMLGRFLCPVTRLGELAAHLDGTPARLSVILRPSPSGDVFGAYLSEDLKAIRGFGAKQAGRAQIEALEVKPPGILASTEWLATELEEAVDVLAQEGMASLPLFLETSFSPSYRETIGAVVQGIAAARAEKRSTACLKLRCGGVEPSAFPPPEQLAWAIACSRDASVPFKATAGLHHPVRHWNEGVKARMHGFLNLLTAAVLAGVHDLPEGRIAEILLDESPAHFRFSDGEIAWQELRASASEVAGARKTQALSFGSCSFEEPREDLRQLGLL